MLRNISMCILLHQPRKIELLLQKFCLVFFLFAMNSEAQDVSVVKDEVFAILEDCSPNYTKTQLDAEASLELRLNCTNPCIESGLNEWLSKDAANKYLFFSGSNVFLLEASAGLRRCRIGESRVSKTQCLAHNAPDIVKKIGKQECGFRMVCDTNFDIDEFGAPVRASARCPSGEAQAEFEREALCLLDGMKYPAHAGRDNVTQPFEMKEDQCPNS